MKVLKLTGKALLVLLGAVVLVLVISVGVNYRPSAVVGKRIDPGAIESLDGGAVRLSEHAGRVILLNFATNW